MDHKLEAFVARVPDFATLKPSQQLEYFVYYLTEVERTDGVLPAEVTACFAAAKIPAYSNIPAYLAANVRKTGAELPKFVKLKDRYYLHREFSAKLAGTLKGSHLVVAVKSDLRNLLPKIRDNNQQAFLKEALVCFEVDAYRATIIMTWLLTLDHLADFIMAHRLGDFNNVLAKSTDKRVKITAVTHKDEFSEIPENKFIEFCRAAKIISNDVRKILDAKLGIRNTCAHPSGVVILESKAVDVVDDLVNNVILKYPV